MDDSTQRKQKQLNLSAAKYLYDTWVANRRLYEEQIRTGKDNKISFIIIKNKHPKFKDLKPLNLEQYLEDWELEHMGDDDGDEDDKNTTK